MRRFELGLVAVTRGAAGSSIYTQDGGRTDAGPAAVEGLRDTVGAGDAYAAVLAAGVLGQWPLDGLLAAATDFAARICTIDGAVPTNGAFYDGIRSRIEEIKHG